MNQSVKTIALDCLKQHFPECNVAFLAGSSIHNEQTEYSDIDMIIIDETIERPFHQCIKFENRVFEWFVFNPDSLSFMFEISRLEGIPTIPHMCAEGYILKDDGTANAIKETAKACISEGPARLTKEKDRNFRYNITDLLLDFDSSLTTEEKFFIAHELFDTVSKYILKANGYWQGHGKWMYRSLKKYDADFVRKFSKEYITFIQSGNSEPFRKSIDHILNDYGGRVFTGFKETI